MVKIFIMSSHRYYCIRRGIYSSPASIYDFQAHGMSLGLTKDFAVSYEV